MTIKQLQHSIAKLSAKSVNLYLLNEYKNLLLNRFKNRYEFNTKKSLCDGVKSMSAKDLFNYFTASGVKLQPEIDYNKETGELINVYENIDDIQENIQNFEYDTNGKTSLETNQGKQEISREDKERDVEGVKITNNKDNIVSDKMGASETKATIEEHNDISNLM